MQGKTRLDSSVAYSNNQKKKMEQGKARGKKKDHPQANKECMKSIIDPPSPPPYPDSSRTRNAVSAQLLQLPSCSQRCTARTARALAGKYTICCCTQAVQGQGRLSDPARWVAASLRRLSAVGRSSVQRACLPVPASVCATLRLSHPVRPINPLRRKQETYVG